MASSHEPQAVKVPVGAFLSLNAGLHGDEGVVKMERLLIRSGAASFWTVGRGPKLSQHLELCAKTSASKCR
jgi:hypothetical protein